MFGLQWGTALGGFEWIGHGSVVSTSIDEDTRNHAHMSQT